MARASRKATRRGHRPEAAVLAVLVLGAAAALTLWHLAQELPSLAPGAQRLAVLARPVVHGLRAAAAGRFSLGFIVFSSLALFGLVCAMFLYMLVFRAYHHLREVYREKRRAVYEPGIEKLLMEAPFEEVEAAFRPRRWGDADIAQEVMVESMRHLKGPPFETLARIAYRLGFIERNLKRLRSRSRHARGRAMESLGIMRSPLAIVNLLDTLEAEPLDLKLVALRALAEIRDPAALPYYVRISDRLPPAVMVRLASLMLEFGPPSREKIGELVARHPEAFPPRVRADLEREVAAHLGAS